MLTRLRSPIASLLLVLLLAMLCAACSAKRSYTSVDASAASGAAYGEAAGMSSASEYMPAPEADARADADASAKEDMPGSVSQQPVEPGPSILTAGEWNDNAEYAFWLNLIQTNQDWRAFFQNWGMESSRRMEVKATAGGKPAANAVVELLDVSNNRPVWAARTDNTGTAYVFADFNQKEARANRATEPFAIKVSYAGQERQKACSSGQKTYDFAFAGSTPAANALELMFVVDTTGSMGDELEFLKAEMVNVLDQVRRDNANIPTRLSVNVYRDLSDDYVVRSTPFDNNFQKVQTFLEQQSANGGGDFPEAVELALDDALNKHDWNLEARARLLFLVLDAPPHNTEIIVRKMHKLTAQAAAEGIRIIPVASSGVDKDTEFLLRSMAIASGGTYVFLTDDSGVGNPHLTPTIGPYDVEKLNSLLVRLIGNYIK